MATMHAKTASLEMTLRPYRIAGEGHPTWIRTRLELRRNDGVLLSTTLSVTKEDLAELQALVREVVTATRSEFSITTMDEDLIIEVRRVESPNDVAIGFWTGEPYDLIVGYRFVVGMSDLAQFATDIRADEESVAPPSRLP